MRHVLRATGRAALWAVGIALVARVLMRLVARDTYADPTFSVVGTLGICLLFAVSGVGAATVRALTTRVWLVVVVVLVTSFLLWESDLAIGLTSYDDARAQPMTTGRWVAFWALFATISALALLTPYLGARLGARHGARRAGPR